MGEGGGGEEKGRFSPLPLSLFRFHLSPFPQKRLILRLVNRLKSDSDGYIDTIRTLQNNWVNEQKQ